MIIYLLLALFSVIALLALIWLYSLSSVKDVGKFERLSIWKSSRQYVLLAIDVPKLNEKTPLAAEHMFAAIHGIYQATSEFQDHLSFEIMAKGTSIRFYVYIPNHAVDFVQSQIYAQYPTVEISEVEDYTSYFDAQNQHFVGSELEMTKPDVYPIKTFMNFNVDPLAGITSALSTLTETEEVWIQMVVKPVDDSWQQRGEDLIAAIKKGKPKTESIAKGVAVSLASIATSTVKEVQIPGSSLPKDKKEEKAEAPKLNGSTESALKGIGEKITKLGFSTQVRLIAVSSDLYDAQAKVNGVIGAFKQFNTTNLNGFVSGQLVADDHELLDRFCRRELGDKAPVMNIEELASLYHFPSESVETPHIVWTSAKKGEPPANLPLVGSVPAEKITRIGKTNFRNSEKEFGILLTDRRRHAYVIGKSGTGKSTLLENMIVDDIREGRGVILVDPHGEAVDHVLANVPEERIDDVVIFDPSDRAHPIGFNLLETVDEDLKGIVASGFVGIFKKIFGNSWGPRLEHILRNSVLALLDYTDSTMLGIVKMLTEKKYRDKVVAEVKDPVIRDFWENEFASWDQKFASEAASPILNKVGQFIATSTIRNIVGQPHSTFDVRKIMDEGKILLINLSRGKIGEDNSSLLGAMMITKIQLAAMSRADIPENERTDCYLYVDEFQNFATESFATILSEARKYHLNLIMANQYIAQMQDEVKDAVFGNVGTLIAFRVGASDASDLAHEFTPVFTETDLVNQDIHKIYIKLSINGMTGQAFSANALPPYKAEISYVDQIIEASSKKYTRLRADVEAEIEGPKPPTAEEKKVALLSEEAIELPPIKIKSENILDGLYYKRQDAKGGVVWWEGYSLDDVMAEEERKRQKFLAKKIEKIKSATTLSDTKAENTDDPKEEQESTTISE